MENYYKQLSLWKREALGKENFCFEEELFREWLERSRVPLARTVLILKRVINIKT
jgi:hypothetical protein